jgi:septin family protein
MTLAVLLSLFIVITENGVRLRLNIVDTPGYGDQVDNENWYVTLFYFYLGFDRNVKFVAGTRL